MTNDTKKIRIGLDIHGVIDKYLDIFVPLTHKWIKKHEIYIITGQEWDKVSYIIYENDIAFTDHFSIVDYHKTIGTKIWDNDMRGLGYWMDKSEWIKSKGMYATSIGLNIHFDDTPEYFDYFPKTCKTILVADDFDITFVPDEIMLMD